MWVYSYVPLLQQQRCRQSRKYCANFIRKLHIYTLSIYIHIYLQQHTHLQRLSACGNLPPAYQPACTLLISTVLKKNLSKLSSAPLICACSTKELAAQRITTMLLYVCCSGGKLDCVWFCGSDKKLAAKGFVVFENAELISTWHGNGFLSKCVCMYACNGSCRSANVVLIKHK